MMDPRLVPGGGAIEMTLANKLIEGSKLQEPVIANAQGGRREPRDHLAHAARELRRRHHPRADAARGSMRGANTTWGIDGEKGTLADMAEVGVREPVAVKLQTIKTAVELLPMLLRIDEIVLGRTSREEEAADPAGRARGRRGRRPVGGGCGRRRRRRRWMRPVPRREARVPAACGGGGGVPWSYGLRGAPPCATREAARETF